MRELIQSLIDDYFPIFSSKPKCEYVSDTWLRVVGSSIEFEDTIGPFLEYTIPRSPNEKRT